MNLKNSSSLLMKCHVSQLVDRTFPAYISNISTTQSACFCIIHVQLNRYDAFSLSIHYLCQHLIVNNSMESINMWCFTEGRSNRVLLIKK